MDIAYWRDVSIIVVSMVFSISLAVLVVESLVLYRKIARVVDAQRQSQEKVANILSFIDENIRSVAGLAGLILGIKKTFESFSQLNKERREPQ